MEINALDTVQDVTLKIARRYHIVMYVNTVVLMFNGYILSRYPLRPLIDWGVRNGSTLILDFINNISGSCCCPPRF